MVLTCGNRKPTQPPPLETHSYSCRSALRPRRVLEKEKPGGVQPHGVLLVHRGRRAQAAALVPRFLPGVHAIGELEILAPALSVAALVEQAQGRPAAAGELVDEFASATDGRGAWQ